MPDNDWDEMLVAATGEVLETMFFASVYGPAQLDGAAAEPRLAARLGFEGTPSGILTLSVSEPAVRGLAANFLGAEQDDQVPFAQLGGVVCELANMICGALLTRVQTEVHFRLSSPELVPDGDPGLHSAPRQSLAVGDGVGDGTIDLWLAVEHHAN